MAFVKYQKEKVKKGISANSIGINNKGRFAFYKQVVERHLGSISYVELFFDPEQQKIGILPKKEPSSDSFRIQGKTTKMIVAKKFLNRFQINLENRRYEFNMENGMLVIKL